MGVHGVGARHGARQSTVTRHTSAVENFFDSGIRGVSLPRVSDGVPNQADQSNFAKTTQFDTWMIHGICWRVGPALTLKLLRAFAALRGCAFWKCCLLVPVLSFGQAAHL